MNHTITTTLWDKYFRYLDDEAKSKNITKKSIIEKWLEYYKKYELESRVKQGLKSRKEEYKKINWELTSIQFKSLKD